MFRGFLLGLVDERQELGVPLFFFCGHGLSDAAGEFLGEAEGQYFFDALREEGYDLVGDGGLQAFFELSVDAGFDLLRKDFVYAALDFLLQAGADFLFQAESHLLFDLVGDALVEFGAEAILDLLPDLGFPLFVQASGYPLFDLLGEPIFIGRSDVLLEGFEALFDYPRDILAPAGFEHIGDFVHVQLPSRFKLLASLELGIVQKGFPFSHVRSFSIPIARFGFAPNGRNTLDFESVRLGPHGGGAEP